MRRVAENPDRDFSVDRLDEPEADALRRLLRQSETAEQFDNAVRERVGQMIARTVYRPPWQLGAKRR